MDDLISRRKVLDMLNCAYSAWCTDEVRKAIEKISIAVDDLPSAQAERKTGQWIDTTEDWRCQIAWWECSVCGMNVSTRYNYCPDCGSYNRGDQND